MSCFYSGESLAILGFCALFLIPLVRLTAGLRARVLRAVPLRRGLTGMVLVGLAVLLLSVQPSDARKRDRYGYYVTGTAVRVKKIAFMNFKVYWIVHKMKTLPQSKSRQAVIKANVDKQIVMRMLRSVEGHKLRKAVAEAFALNGYRNKANINRFLRVVKGEATKGSYIVISYNAKKQRTSIRYRGRYASVGGQPFMRALWSCWFGRIDQPSMPRALLRKL